MNNLEDIIAKLSAYMARMEEEAKEQYNFKDLTLTQMHYLEMINELENPNLTELASAMKLTKPTITVLVDKLIEKELVYKVQSDADRRSTHLHLSERGKLINQMHEYAHRRIVEQMEKKIDVDEMAQLMALLEKIMK
ncbi:MAG TPA: MarR family transcriptional regulator [Prolixibacteraceae bacterium]|nr:MarR family transcriptional regulator [Prolixibacteraceae bacterium]